MIWSIYPEGHISNDLLRVFTLDWFKNLSNLVSRSTHRTFQQLQHVKMPCCLQISLPGTLKLTWSAFSRHSEPLHCSLHYPVKRKPPAWCCSLHSHSIISNGAWNILLLALDTWAAELFDVRQSYVSFGRWRYLGGDLCMVLQRFLTSFRVKTASGKKVTQLFESQLKAGSWSMIYIVWVAIIWNVFFPLQGIFETSTPCIFLPACQSAYLSILFN